MARFLESELLPNLPKHYQERVSTLINHVRSGAYGAYTGHIVYKGEYHESFQRIFGIEVLCINFRDVFGSSGTCFLQIDLSRDWQVDGSADRKIDPVKPFKLSKNAQRTVDLTLASFDGRHQLPSDLKNYSPEVLAHKLCSEALRLEAVFPSWYRGATQHDLIEIDESKQVVRDLRAAAGLIANLN